MAFFNHGPPISQTGPCDDQSFAGNFDGANGHDEAPAHGKIDETL